MLYRIRNLGTWLSMKKSTFDANRDVSTVHQSRLSIFQATRRPRHLKREITTPWGTVKVDGKLGQNHQDLLDSCFAVAERVVVGEDRRIFIQVDPYLLRKKLHGVPYQRIKEWFVNLRAATLLINAKNLTGDNEWKVTGIVDEATKSHKTINVARRNGLIGVAENSPRHYLRVVISPTWSKLIFEDIGTNYRGQLDLILAMKCGAAQSIARQMLGHAGAAHFSMEKLLASIGAEIGNRNKFRVIHSVLKEAERFKIAGIHVSESLASIGRASSVPGKSGSNRRAFPELTSSGPGNASHIPGKMPPS